MDMTKYKSLFISETSEHLQSLNENLSILQKPEGSGDTDHVEAIAACFRNAHSIKGMAASMGYESVRDLSHSMEDLLDDLRQGQREITPGAVDLLFEGLDLLEKMLREVGEDKEPTIDPEPLRQRIVEFRTGEDGQTPEVPAPASETSTPLPETPAPSPETSPASPEPRSTEPKMDGKAPNLTIRMVLAKETAAAGARGFLIFKRMQDMGEAISSRPGLDEIKAGKFSEDPNGLAMEIDLLTNISQEEIVKTINTLAEVNSFEIRQYRDVQEDDIPPLPEAPEESHPSAPATDPFASPSLPQTVRVKTQALDSFINTLGEMILIKSELKEVAKRQLTPGLNEGLDKLDRIVKEFSDQIMEIRLMPLESVTMRLPGAVRELSRDEGKKVRFETIGKEIELDRAILEQLTDPLLHLLRNSVSHGIEQPEEREKTGKDPAGSILLEAYRQRDMVLLDIRDDGRGLDPFQIKETALAKGLITQETAETMSEEDIFQLIFIPGFSTAKQVGMVSGRGVGMDVVKSTVEGLGGFVTVSSVLSLGTTITLHLPRTIAIVNVLLIRLEKEIFAIPITKIQKTVEIMPHQIRQSQKQKYYLDRQELVPLLDLHRFLDMASNNNQFPLQALLVEVQKRKIALTVDELIGQEEAFIRPLGKPLEKISGLAGVTMLGDGRIVFVLDTMGLL
jgi:two-component system chemotaxis sensor kinase CheA